MFYIVTPSSNCWQHGNTVLTGIYWVEGMNFDEQNQWLLQATAGMYHLNIEEKVHELPGHLTHVGEAFTEILHLTEAHPDCPSCNGTGKVQGFTCGTCREYIIL